MRYLGIILHDMRNWCNTYTSLDRWKPININLKSKTQKLRGKWGDFSKWSNEGQWGDNHSLGERRKGKNKSISLPQGRGETIMKSKIKWNAHIGHLKGLSNQHSWSKREGYNVKNKQELYIEEKNVIQG